MRLVLIVPYVALLVVGQAALDAVSVVVAEREGGMGLGSALIVAHVVQLAGIAAGAVAAAYLIDRGFARLALLAGALLFYTGFVAVAMAPMGALSWVVVALCLAGIGFGSILTTVFSVAAGVVARARPVAIMLLLLAPVGARSIVGVMSPAGTLALTVAAAIVVAIAVLLARLSGIGLRSSLGSPSTEDHDTRLLLSTRDAVVGGTLVAVGVGLTLGGADPSRVSGAVMAGILGLGDLAALDGARAGMVVIGLAMVIGGSIVLVARQRPGRSVVLAVAATALAAFAAGGTLAALSLAVRFGGAPGDRAIALAGTAALGGSALGLLLGGWWLARGGRLGALAIAGTLIVAVVTVFGLVALRSSTAPLDVSVHIGALAVIGLGGGLAASALRVLLAEVAVHQRGMAAGAGVVAASFGSALGFMIGTGEGMTSVSGNPDALAAGVIVLVAAATGAVAAVVWSPSIRPARC